MIGSLTVGSFVEIREGCPIRFAVGGSGMAFVECGESGESFALNMDSEALREFLRLGTETLRDMDERFAMEEAERAG